MNEKELPGQEPPEHWEPSFYETGRTRPPKSYRGLIALLLVTVIFLGGIVSALSMLNIHLFQQVQNQSADKNSPVLFSPPPEMETTSQADTVGDASAYRDLSLQLQDTPASPDNYPQENALPLQEIYSKTAPTVVSVTTRTPAGNTAGAGVILTEDGYIVTSCHLVRDAISIQVRLWDNRTCTGSIVGIDPVSDLAVVRIRADRLTPAEFGNSASMRVGDPVVSIGDPLGAELGGTMTDGIVSAINQDVLTNGRMLTLLQTSAMVNAGHSGGPLLNCYGQVIGIHTVYFSNYADDEPHSGIAIPSAAVKEIVDQLVSQGYVSGRPTPGFSGQALTAMDQMVYQLPQGLYITQVHPGCDAQKKGILPGDILLTLDNTPIYTSDDFYSVLYQHQIGDVVQALIYRDGIQYSVSITLTEAHT